MNPWLEAGILALLLIIGAIAGWLLGKKLGLHSPNLIVSLAILMCGSVGGPLVTYKFIGTGFVSFAVAMLIAGVAAGIVFWPMGEDQSEKQRF